MLDFRDLWGYVTPLLYSVAFVLLVGFANAVIQIVLGRLRQPIPVSHKIAVIGLPGAGKTTLITALFELIQRGVHIPQARLHGMNTIKNVNQNVARLNSGQRIGPTIENEIFVYRFSYKKTRQLRPVSYDVEIADFPGEYSERIASPLSTVEAPNAIKSKRKARPQEDAELSLEYTLFNQEFFSWIASSREYLFLVDMAKTYSSANVRGAIAEITARIRTSWQVIEDSASERAIGSTSRRSVFVIFTKVDCIVPVFADGATLKSLVDANPARGDSDIGKSSAATVKELISVAGDAENLAQPASVPAEVLVLAQRENDELFSDLLQFFSSRVRNVNVIYSSMGIKEADDNNRLGVKKVLEAVLP